MLTGSLDRYRERFDALASAWMGIGASCVQLLKGDELVFACPTETAVTGSALVAHSQDSRLSLQIYGNFDESWRLAAEFMLEVISRLFASDSELESLTAALVEAQDRLVAIYELTQVTRRTLDVSMLLDLLIQESR